MGSITISWQGSTEEYTKGYEFLMHRVYQDEAFASLRINSKEIVFKQRNSLSEVYEALIDSGDSAYILPLVDDDVFIRGYDLVNHPASRYFIENADILSCGIRLGDNLSDQVSSTSGSGVVYETPRGHAVSLLSTGKPRFIIPRHYHLMSSNNGDQAEYLVWAWPENLNVPHWACIFSLTSHIFRKKMYIDIFNKVGKNNFLCIEGEGHKYLIRMFLGLSPILFDFLRLADKILMRIQRKKGIYEQELLLILFAKYLYRKWTYQHKKIRVPHLMVCPPQSVVCNLDVGTSHHREDASNTSLVEAYNQAYLNGYIISYEMIPMDKIVFATHIFQGFEMKKYS